MSLLAMQQKVLARMEDAGYVRDEYGFARDDQEIIVLRKPFGDREIVQILTPSGQVFPLAEVA